MEAKKRIKDINWLIKLLQKDRKDDLRDIRRLMIEKRKLQGKI